MHKNLFVSRIKYESNQVEKKEYCKLKQIKYIPYVVEMDLKYGVIQFKTTNMSVNYKSEIVIK